MAAFAAPASPPTKEPKVEPIPIVYHKFEGPEPNGLYSYSYETGNGIQMQEHGQLVKIADNVDALHVEGSYSYPDANGNPISMTYVADENGFQPKSDILPTPPPIPEGILKSLQYIALHPEEDNLD